MMTRHTKAETGIASWTCHCGDHVFGYPFDDALDTWRKYRVTHPVIRKMMLDKGMVVDTPPPLPEPYVILVSLIDAPLLALRRWRVFRSPTRKKAKFEVKRGLVGRALQRMVLPGAEIVQFLAGDGTDCRRVSLLATTRKKMRRTSRVATTITAR